MDLFAFADSECRKIKVEFGDFSDQKRIGEGIYSTVLAAWNRKLQRREVIKVMRVSLDGHAAGDAALKAALRELLTLRIMQEARKDARAGHVVELFGWFVDQGSIAIRLEYMDADLARLLSTADDALEMKVALKIATDVFSGLSFIHSLGVAVRDVKPANVLLSRFSGRAKLADFGLARAVGTMAPPALSHVAYESREVFTRWYRPVESLLGCRANSLAGDVWSAGLVIAELLNHGPLFPGISDINQIFLIYEAFGQPCLADWPELADLHDFGKVPFLQNGPTQPTNWAALVPRTAEAPFLVTTLHGCLRLNPHKRLTAEETLASLAAGDPECVGSSHDAAMWVDGVLGPEAASDPNLSDTSLLNCVES